MDGEECLLHFTVSDTGVGIAAAVRKLIFDPFTQADSSTTRTYGGTGLGLAISARLVKMMAGEIWVESEPGRGSQFHFSARLGTPDEGAAVKHPMARSDISGAAKVLIVDDNRTNRGILEGLLKNWGMRPASSRGGEEALMQLRAAHESGDPYKLCLLYTSVEKYGGDFAYVEGPVWSKEGFLLFSDMFDSRIMKMTGANHAEIYRDFTNGANGNSMDVQGRLYSCERDGRRVVRMEKDGKLTVIAAEYQGCLLYTSRCV